MNIERKVIGTGRAKGTETLLLAVSGGFAEIEGDRVHVLAEHAISEEKIDEKAVEEALKLGGYPAFLTALRSAPEVGYVELGGQKYAIRWARQTDERNRTAEIASSVFITRKSINARATLLV